MQHVEIFRHERNLRRWVLIGKMYILNVLEDTQKKRAVIGLYIDFCKFIPCVYLYLTIINTHQFLSLQNNFIFYFHSMSPVKLPRKKRSDQYTFLKKMFSFIEISFYCVSFMSLWVCFMAVLFTSAVLLYTLAIEILRFIF